MNSSDTSPEIDLYERGVSLVEVAAALAVTTLLASVAIPQLSGLLTRTSIHSEALALRLFLERTYIHVLSSRQGVSIDCSEQILVARRETGEPVATHLVRRGITLDVASIPERKLLIHPTGTTSPATLELKKGTMSCLVIMSLRGRMRVTC